MNDKSVNFLDHLRSQYLPDRIPLWGVPIFQTTLKFLNCHGSVLSTSSG